MVFRIRNSIWNLCFVENISRKLLRSDGTMSIGVTDNNDKCVYIADGLDAELKEKVICHELTHCVCFEYNISIPLETEEWLCNFMSEHGKEIIYILDDILDGLLKEVA